MNQNKSSPNVEVDNLVNTENNTFDRSNKLSSNITRSESVTKSKVIFSFHIFIA
jgi:hypothetical protein